ncbi:hypothetical protein JO972_04525 [Verrucomicrobiaceae bacterium 5K15]|uniref:Uncharacterized protein n=1 Tax=Oceaniferula flava TaxID=2800421 RepID=A0AAE2S9I2_9BACT|nr:hypothetical protein [Oceaniferula flavus]MBK1854208.1 hypothetical protein [Oceaniferula flavus]MBM1135514.1 hypothetical protein [Oceaniferula flavus]
MKTHINHQPAGNRQGFALIATISVMVLLVMIALSMLSLSTVELRQKSHEQHQKQAQANARMALMIALGDLQKYAGPDRRVTATASILGDSVSPHKRNYTTVWDTSEWDVTDPVASRDSQAYMAALVSGRDEDTPATRATATSELSTAVPTSDSRWVSLVAEGSVEDEDDFVYAEKVDVDQGSNTGSYAYWVGDEGVKARFDIAVADDSATQTWATAGRMGVPMGTGIHKMTDMDAYEEYLPDGSEVANLPKFLTLGSVDLSNIDQAAVGRHFHDVTSSHVGLLVDNRWGGIRRDLSTAFELDIEDFNEVEEFSAAEEVNLTSGYSSFTSDTRTNPLYYSDDTDESLGFLYEIPVDSTNRYRGPTWDVLRNHYRTYKKERNELNFRGVSVSSGSDALVAHSVVPFTYNRQPGTTDNRSLGSRHQATHSNSNSSQNFPIVSKHGVAGSYDTFQNGARNEPTVQKVAPQLIRMVMQYGLARDNNDYYITLNPFFVVHNPYNYPIEFYSMSVDLAYFNFLNGMEVTYTEAGTGSTKTQLFTLGSGGHSQKLQSFRILPSSTGNNRLEPGQIKVVSVSGGFTGTSGDSYVIPTEMQYNEAAGVYLGGGVKKTMNVEPNSQITTKIFYSRFKSGYLTYQIPQIFSRLHHPLQADGSTATLLDQSDASGDSFIYDRQLYSLIQSIQVTPASLNEVTTTKNVNSFPEPAVGGLGLFTLDMGLKDYDGNAAVMSDFNYRALATSSADYDKSHEVAPNWDLILSDTQLSSLQIAGSDRTSAYWGESKSASGGGSSKVVLFDLPHAPMVSLGGLQHADTSKFNLHAMRSIGHSRPQVGASDLRKLYNKFSATRFTGTSTKYQFDTSWAANEALWDRYFFSGINWGGADSQPYSSHVEAVTALTEGEVDKVLANSRLTLVDLPSSDDLSDLQDYTKIGNYLGIAGAFNVNSTSVDAWKAVLSSLSGREISYLSGTSLVNETMGADVSPISRFSTPASLDDDYSGIRALDDGELDKLAEAIVEQVKERGPFMGLADFVNRRLLSDDTGEAGAIQAAIDESDVNNGFEVGSTSGNGLARSAPTASEGMPRQLDQGDVLNLLGPVIATRSDTFIIRAYGDSKDSAGNIKARAWCEAVVQRTPEWVVDPEVDSTVQNPDYPSGNSTSEPILRQWIPNTSLPETAETFGRRFKVSSFRWLSANEI